MSEQSAASEITAKISSVPSETGESVTPDGKRVYEPGKDESKIDFSSRFAALTKREKEIMARDKAIKEKEQTIAEYQKAKEMAKTDPLKFMELHGLTYDQLTNFILDSSHGEKPSIEQKVTMLEERLEREATEKEAAKQREIEADEERIIKAYQDEIQKHVAENADECEMIRLTDNYDLVFEVAKEHFEASGQILSVSEAAKAVEDYLTTEAREKILKAKKFSKGDDSKTAQETGNVFAEKLATKSPTLTNEIATDGGNSVNPYTPHWVDAEESKRRAAAFLEAQLSRS